MRQCTEAQNQWDSWTPNILSISQELHLPNVTSALMMIETFSLEEKG